MCGRGRVRGRARLKIRGRGSLTQLGTGQAHPPSTVSRCYSADGRALSQSAPLLSHIYGNIFASAFKQTRCRLGETRRSETLVDG